MSLTDILLDQTFAIVFYFVLIAVASFWAWRSNLIPLRLIACWMVVEWLGYNLILQWIGLERAPWLIPSFDVIPCLAVTHIAVRHRSREAWEIVRLFALEFIFVVLAFLVHQQGTAIFYAGLNAISIGQWSVFGGAGLVELVYRARRSRQRHGHQLFGPSLGREAMAWTKRG